MTLVSAVGDPEGCRHAAVDDPSAVAAARRMASELAARAGLSETDVGRVALLVTEAATNVLKHAGGGEILVRILSAAPGTLEILALDAGPGLAPERLLTEGYSSTGTLGVGLGAMRRQSDAFDMYARPGKGTVLRLEVRAHGTQAPAPGALTFGVVSIPLAGESVSGDGWAVCENAQGVQLVAVDGLGHGFLANDAALAAVAQVRRAHESPTAVLTRMHDALRATRGAAAAVASVDLAQGVLRYAGVGNISGCVVSGGRARSLLSLNGIVGHNARRFHETTQPCGAGDTIILASDGLGTHWSLDDYPGLLEHHPAIVAAVLYRDHTRRRDDCAVLVGKLGAP